MVPAAALPQTNSGCRSALRSALKRLRIGSMRPLAAVAADGGAATPSQQPAPRAAGAASNRDRTGHFDKIDSLFKEVGIDKALFNATGGIRTRQHRNPLIRELQVPAPPLPWPEIYPELGPGAPLVLDIGAGYGRFLLTLSTRWTGHNMLGLEIRDPVISRANKWASQLGLQSRVRFHMANATVSVESLLATYEGRVDWVLVQFPDPHFKKKHRKRRVVQPELVAALARLLPPGAKVLLQSDVLDAAEDMRDKFEAAGGATFRLAQPHGRPEAVFHASSADQTAAGPQGEEGEEDGEQQAAAGSTGGDEDECGQQFASTWAASGWLLDNPVGVPTEREVYVLQAGLPVYRVLLERTEAPAPA